MAVVLWLLCCVVCVRVTDVDFLSSNIVGLSVGLLLVRRLCESFLAIDTTYAIKNK